MLPLSTWLQSYRAVSCPNGEYAHWTTLFQSGVVFRCIEWCCLHAAGLLTHPIDGFKPDFLNLATPSIIETEAHTKIPRFAGFKRIWKLKSIMVTETIPAAPKRVRFFIANEMSLYLLIIITITAIFLYFSSLPLSQLNLPCMLGSIPPSPPEPFLQMPPLRNMKLSRIS